MKMARRVTLIIAIVAFLEVLAAVTARPCTVVSPECGFTVFTAPTDFTVNLSDPVDPISVQGSDFTVNGTPADAFALSNNNTTIDFIFNTSPAVPGLNTMHISAGAFDCGPPVDFNCTFSYRVLPTPRPRPTPRRPHPPPTPASI
jgi:hypothetical protein